MHHAYLWWWRGWLADDVCVRRRWSEIPSEREREKVTRKYRSFGIVLWPVSVLIVMKNAWGSSSLVLCCCYLLSCLTLWCVSLSLLFSTWLCVSSSRIRNKSFDCWTHRLHISMCVKKKSELGQGDISNRKMALEKTYWNQYLTCYR